jgi:arylsulfatase A-like enzyme
VDWLPTCCALAGVKPPDDRALDGENILPLLSGNEWVRREAIFWFYYNARGYANMGLREGDYSLLARRTMGDYRAGTSFVPERIAAVKLCRPRSPQLFNLRKDVTQTYDLAEEEPDRFADMYDQLQRRLQAVQDEAPVW